MGTTDTTSAIEFHDSTLERIETVPDGLLVVLDACVHQSAGIPGVDEGVCGYQPACIRITGGVLKTPLPEDEAELWTGSLVCDGVTYDNVVPTSVQGPGTIELRLSGADGREHVVTGDGVSITLIGTPELYERFDGSA